eukprot:CAMPEP_0171084088 /NCGR_PEP_ID=MMETSP0766_2-20121228/18106_1 /TAXON_ID=439317 /ORGANISM="Gambierdiscus australes, Strain CAWD 149" /LENGTH=464 /DNA_ID=CAMNT_0011541569 /DNA_START=48 /DNA_END=1442 /DNA_ORIENTATION=-
MVTRVSQKRQSTLLDSGFGLKLHRAEGNGPEITKAKANGKTHAAESAVQKQPGLALGVKREGNCAGGKSAESKVSKALVEKDNDANKLGTPPVKREDWFSALFGFSEVAGYAESKRWLRIWPALRPGEPQILESLLTGEKFGCGCFEAPTLAELRSIGRNLKLPGRLRVTNELGDVGAKHALRENRHAVFQAASQFNCLEFVGPSVRPEDGVACYAMDRTQGPCCAIACGAGTVFRNYFVPLDAHGRMAANEGSVAQRGQTEKLQLLNLADLGTLLTKGAPQSTLFEVKGGYTLAGKPQLTRFNEALRQLKDLDTARSQIRIGVHRDVQVTSARWGREQLRDAEQTVTQVYGSACSVAYNQRSNPSDWASFGTLVLEASYEATLWAAVLSAARHKTEGSRRIFLTCLGGGVFGNRMEWIEAAMDRAFTLFREYDLDVRIVTYGGNIDPRLRALEAKFGGKRKFP